MPIIPTSAMSADDHRERQERLAARRELYTFEDRAPFFPVPLMKPLSASRKRQMEILAALMQLREGLNTATDTARAAGRSLLSAVLPESIKEPLRGLEQRVKSPRFHLGIDLIIRRLLHDLDDDPDHTNAMELVLEIILDILDSDHDSPYPYNDLLYALFDLPPRDMLDDLLWRPSFPGANPDGLYINVRNTDLMRVQLMGREMRRRIPFSDGLGRDRRFEDLQKCAAFFPEPELRCTTAIGEPRSDPRTLHTLLIDDDFEFAWQRLGGVNPVVLRRLLPEGAESRDGRPLPGRPLPGRPLPLEAWPDLEASLGDFEAVMDQVVGERVSLSRALADGRLFVADYPEILAANSGRDLSQPRIFTATIGLFYAHPEQGLLPVAIRLNSGADARVFTPLEAGSESRSWRSAKVFFQVADLVHHEMVTHLLESHFILEGIAVATRRQLDVEHPIGALLHAHLRGVVFNLMVGRRLLLAENNGMVDLLFPLEPGQWINVMRAGYRRWRAEDLDTPGTFARRGTGTDSALVDYPFRDDSLLLWEALRQYVAEYLDIFYPDDPAVAADGELAAWRAELLEVYARPVDDESSADAAARAAGFDFSTKEELTRLLTGIIFTSGPRHAAVNFAQWDYMMFVGNTPASAYTTHSEHLAPAEHILPTVDQIVNQMEVIQLLAGRQFGRLGYFPEDEFPASGQLSQRIQLVIRRFQERLVTVGAEIDARNTARPAPFPYLHPELVPNSANV